MARIKTRYVGVYYRFGKNRYTQDGKRDKCFDIHYKAHGKYIWEKIGWRSEGYTIHDAIEIRGLRVKALRHPELSQADGPQPSRQKATISDAWGLYKKNWFPNIKSSNNIEYIYNKHIGPNFANVEIEEITFLQIEQFKQQLLKQSTGTGRSLKAGTVKEILSCFRRIINKSKDLGLISENINPTKNVVVSSSDNKRERFLSQEEVRKLLDALCMTSITFYRVAKISVCTGLRLSEILYMKSQDVDLDSGIIYINGKTGRRCAFIPDTLKTLFSQIIPQRHSVELFLSDKGKRISQTWFSGKFTDIANSIGFNDGILDNSQKVVFHTLRHTFCSWLAMKGVPLYTIGELVGHSTVDMTKRYAKLSPDTKREALKFIADIL